MIADKNKIYALVDGLLSASVPHQVHVEEAEKGAERVMVARIFLQAGADIASVADVSTPLGLKVRFDGTQLQVVDEIAEADFAKANTPTTTAKKKAGAKKR